MSKQATSSKVVIRRATREDVEAFGELPHSPTIKAWVGDVDGRIVGIGGFYFYKGRWVGFCDLTEEASRYKVSFIRAARLAMDDMKRAGHKFIYAEVDPDYPMAPKWVGRLGFQKTKSGIWRWRQ